MLSALKKHINNHFGSKRGLLNTLKYKFLFWLGRYQRYQKIDFSRVERLVFICAGNICRSPFADYLARSMGLDSVSYGLHCRGNDKADERTIEFAQKHGIEMSGHITQNISQYCGKTSDLLIVMEPKHVCELKPFIRAGQQITIAPLWFDKASAYLHDPFGANAIFFEKCETSLIMTVSNIGRQLRKI